MSRLALISILGTGCVLLHPHNGSSKAVAHVDPGPWAGPLAQQYAGKVVFSSAPIPMDGKDASAAFTSYTLGDPLFIRYWAADAPQNLQPCTAISMTGNQAMVKSELYADVNNEGAGQPLTKLTRFGGYEFDDKGVKTRPMASLSNELERAFTSPMSLSNQEEAGEATVRRFNTDVIPKLHEGDNTIRIVVALTCANRDDRVPMAEGTLNVHVAPGAKVAYLAKYGPRVQASPNPENDKISREIIAAMKKMPDWSNEVFIGASVTSETWEPVRNEVTGALVAYQIQALLFVRQKSEKDPDHCRAFDMTYRRDPAGGSLYHAGTGNMKAFPCAAAPHS